MARARAPNHSSVFLLVGASWGLYLAPLTPSSVTESGPAYLEFLNPILLDRKASCSSHASEGLPDFVVMDNGPAYALYTIAAMGDVWPSQVYGMSAPPTPSASKSRNHIALDRNVVSICSDPPRRRWHWQKYLKMQHPAFHGFDSCLQYALQRISSPILTIDVQGPC